MNYYFITNLLAIIQGLTEFLPVSSSGHLVILQNLINIGIPVRQELLLDVMLHLGTLFAIILFYRKKIGLLFIEFWAYIKLIYKQKNLSAILSFPKDIFYIIIATIITGFAGILLNNYVEELFGTMKFIGYIYIINSIILLSNIFREGSKNGQKHIDQKNNFVKTVIIAISQSFAIIPGISRSGSTITAALHLGLKKNNATEFSFLISIPAILGAVFLNILKVDFNKVESSIILPAMISIIVSFIVGFFSLKLLLWLIKKAKLYIFGIYSFILGVAVLIYNIIN